MSFSFHPGMESEQSIRKFKYLVSVHTVCHFLLTRTFAQTNCFPSTWPWRIDVISRALAYKAGGCCCLECARPFPKPRP